MTRSVRGQSSSRLDQSNSVNERSDAAGMLVIGIYIVATAAVPYLYGKYLFVALSLVLLLALVRGRRLPICAMLWVATLGSLGALGGLIGSINNNPGASSTLSVFLFEPVVIGTLFGSIGAVRNWRQMIVRSLDWALVAAASLGLIVYVASRIGVHLPIELVDPQYATVDLANGTLRTNFQGYNSLVFLAPYGICRYSARANGVGDTWRILLLALSLSGIMLSGRRILYLSVPLALLVTFILFRRSTSREEKSNKALSRSVGVIAAIATLAYLLNKAGIHLADAFTRTLSQVSLSDTTDLRSVQASELLHAWLSSPIWGQGAGAVIRGHFRSAESPWSFELSYHVILFNFGLLGLLILSAWSVWIALRLIRAGRAGSDLARMVMCGWISTLAAASVDPYLFKIDGMWMVFVPFAVAVAGVEKSSIEASGR